ncbi:MAG: hypothetical protein IT368_12135, partial [Candidatus Hydrogenedentes bacterium]|nr:hypothetical protein [Candidatus Hydrogenedentota bacterium]
LLQSIPLISPDLPEFIESTGGFEKWHSVGPVVFEPPAPLPEWYDELDDGTVNVYITMGSTGLMDQLLRRTFPVLGNAPYRFLVTTGGQVSAETEALAPANFRFTKYAPGGALLKHCQAMIFHGGNTSMYQALAAGVPMIALPSHLEQEVCFRIALKHGFGKQYAPRKVRGEELLGAIDDLIHDPQYRLAARRYVPLVRNSQGAKQAAEILIDTAREGEPAGAGM